MYVVWVAWRERAEGAATGRTVRACAVVSYVTLSVLFSLSLAQSVAIHVVLTPQLRQDHAFSYHYRQTISRWPRAHTHTRQSRVRPISWSHSSASSAGTSRRGGRPPHLRSSPPAQSPRCDANDTHMVHT